jgi:hypothetical protein
MGNFWLGICLGKVVLLREDNLAFGMLKKLGLTFFTFDDWKANMHTLDQAAIDRNRDICTSFFSEERISGLYRELFN